VLGGQREPLAGKYARERFYYCEGFSAGEASMMLCWVIPVLENLNGKARLLSEHVKHTSSTDGT
jgi:hypothetical protein